MLNYICHWLLAAMKYLLQHFRYIFFILLMLMEKKNLSRVLKHGQHAAAYVMFNQEFSNLLGELDLNQIKRNVQFLIN